jgi:hypothetical protein
VGGGGAGAPSVGPATGTVAGTATVGSPGAELDAGGTAEVAGATAAAPVGIDGTADPGEVAGGSPASSPAEPESEAAAWAAESCDQSRTRNPAIKRQNPTTGTAVAFMGRRHHINMVFITYPTTAASGPGADGYSAGA